jgi:hypothetical protein
MFGGDFCHVHRYDRGKESGPFGPAKIDVVAGGDNVNPFEIGLIYPVFVLQNMFFDTATKTAIQDVVACVNRLPNAFANDNRARTQVFT